jgi:hypothetical protein
LYTGIVMALAVRARSQYFVAWLLIAALGGCAHWSPTPAPDIRLADRQCLAAFAEFDQALAASDLRDSEGVAPMGWPFLRLDRFLASFRDELQNDAIRNIWVDALGELDARAREMEATNLASRDLSAPTLQTLAKCRTELIANLRANSAAVTAIAATEVPDEYSGWRRGLGLYPLAVLFARAGVQRLHEDNPVTRVPPATDVPYRIYRWPERGRGRLPNLSSAPRDALDRVQLTAEEYAELFAYHAPTWKVSTASTNDHIGQPVWRGERIAIDPAAPSLYWYSSFTRFEGAVLLQLNYVVWFAARPPRSKFDLLAGDIDGITWRVTLDRDGTPLLYDAMHNCGCYHQFYPSFRLRQKPQREDDEPLWVPLTLTPGPVTIYLAAGSHYITALTAEAAAGVELHVQDYDTLRGIPSNSNRRSIFGPQGIIRGSERLERFVLWPLGVPAPGAMRSRGHHATAFIGRRHFDDPALIARYFERIK